MNFSFLGGRITVHILFIPVALIMLAINGVASVSAFFMALLIHEIAHMMAASALGLDISAIELTPFGCVARTEGFYFAGGAKEVIVAAFGPAANILVAALLLLTSTQGSSSQYLSFFLTANISLAAINLLPILPMDGGRVLCAMLGTAMKEINAVRVVAVVGIAFSAAVLLYGIHMAFQGQINPTIFIVGGFMLAASAGYLKNLHTDMIKHTAGKPREFSKQGMAGVRALAVHKEKTIGRALLGMDTKKYNIIYIVDDTLHILKKVDEGQLLQGALAHGTGAKMEKML